MAAEQTHDNSTGEDTAPPVVPDPPEATAAQEDGGEAVLSETAVTGERESQRPQIGPRILAVEAPSPATPPAPKRGRVRRAPKPKAQQPRRRKRSPAERHRAVFFARLNELRRNGALKADAPDEVQAAGEGEPDATLAAEATIASPEVDAPGQGEPVAEAHAPDQPVAEAVSEQLAGEEQPALAVDQQPVPGAAAQTGSAQRARRGESPPPVAPARVAAAIERVGGPEVVQEALAPKIDEQGERKKWAAVCCDAAQGSPPGDPTFTAWLRLAATPVREIKNHLPQPVDEARGGRVARGRAGGSPREGRRAERSDRDRGSQRDRPSRDDMASYARGGRLTTKVRIVDRAQEKREREQARKEQRERKRQAERERLDRLGY